MKLKNLKKEWLQILIVVLPFCAVALLWDKLPDWIPIHWNARGQVDDYARKSFGAFIIPAINVIVAVVLGLLPLIDPRFGSYDPELRASFWRTLRLIRLFTTGFLSLMSLGLLAVGIGWFGSDAQFSSLIYGGIGLLFVFLGNLMTKLRPNYFIGIRTPWTLESKEVWMKTHRLGAKLMVAGGVLILGLGWVVPSEHFVYLVILPIAALSSLVPMFYSFLLYKKQRVTQVEAH